MNKTKLIALMACLFISRLTAGEYTAAVTSVHDGDTADMRIQIARIRLIGTNVTTNTTVKLGCEIEFDHDKNGYGNLKYVSPVRFNGMQAPEMLMPTNINGVNKSVPNPAGIRARDFMTPLIVFTTVKVTTKGTGRSEKEKFGRVLGDVWLGPTNMSKLSISNGYAVYWNGRNQ